MPSQRSRDQSPKYQDLPSVRRPRKNQPKDDPPSVSNVSNLTESEGGDLKIVSDPKQLEVSSFLSKSERPSIPVLSPNFEMEDIDGIPLSTSQKSPKEGKYIFQQYIFCSFCL